MEGGAVAEEEEAEGWLEQSRREAAVEGRRARHKDDEAEGERADARAGLGRAGSGGRVR